MATEDHGDPLVEALPPASDYLTYLTILEYQLTPARLPTLHRLLQDETLTTNIGWDLVHLLLPLLPASEECLQDVARLGNPREVILRVSDALMKLQPMDDDEENDVSGHNEENAERETSLNAAEKRVPIHILQFNSLVSMLGILHSRIKTQYPSRFIATSLHAALEAYTEHPTVETTTAILEFLRDLSSNKRPALPPRSASEQLIQRAAGASAPDPEAETQLESPIVHESVLTQRLVQFGLIEVLKTYLLQCTNEQPSGMQWALRLQEKLDTVPVPSVFDLTELFNQTEYAKERDTTVGKIIALSRDFGLETEQLCQIVLSQGDNNTAPLDFENIPKTAEDIPLERHGCLILLAARYATAVLFESAELEMNLSLYPEISGVFANYLKKDEEKALSAVAMEAPTPLVDSLLALALLSSQRYSTIAPDNESDFDSLVLATVACARSPHVRQLSLIEKIPSKIFHENPKAASRYNLIRQIFSNEHLQYARESAIGWLKDELLAATAPDAPQSDQFNPFTDKESFSTLFKSIYKSLPDHYSNLSSVVVSHLITEWMKFISEQANLWIVLLNFYYLLCKSEALRELLEVRKLDSEFRENFLLPMKKFAKSVCDDEGISEGIEKELGEEVVHMGKSAAGVVLHVIGQIEDVNWEE
ncbi:YAP1-binding protein 1 [Emydomyces testavorans]|uniref:YAP1-binding protein 1 n=1 Tax=Emydomyces testavorans TaxID=2070801 RepID=A0AAF0IL19_9EURO|nr:YAP1-binding protein 1 [Emydomyces testavorans]